MNWFINALIVGNVKEEEFYCVLTKEHITCTTVNLHLYVLRQSTSSKGCGRYLLWAERVSLFMNVSRTFVSDKLPQAAYKLPRSRSLNFISYTFCNDEVVKFCQFPWLHFLSCNWKVMQHISISISWLCFFNIKLAFRIGIFIWSCNSFSALLHLEANGCVFTATVFDHFTTDVQGYERVLCQTFWGNKIWITSLRNEIVAKFELSRNQSVVLWLHFPPSKFSDKEESH